MKDTDYDYLLFWYQTWEKKKKTARNILSVGFVMQQNIELNERSISTPTQLLQKHLQYVIQDILLHLFTGKKGGLKTNYLHLFKYYFTGLISFADL